MNWATGNEVVNFQVGMKYIIDPISSVKVGCILSLSTHTFCVKHDKGALTPCDFSCNLFRNSHFARDAWKVKSWRSFLKSKFCVPVGIFLNIFVLDILFDFDIDSYTHVAYFSCNPPVYLYSVDNPGNYNGTRVSMH